MHRWIPWLTGIIAFTVVPSSASAERLYVPAVREITEHRTLTSRHFLLADGTYRADVGLEPIHYQASDGSLQPIDTTLVPSDRPDFAYANAANTLKTYLPADGSGWVRLENGKTAVSFLPLGAARGIAVAKGNRLDVQGVGDGVALSYAVQPNRLKETITLSAPGAPTFRYALRTENIKVRRNGDNSFTFLDDSDMVSFVLDAPWMEDATGKRSTALSVDLVPQGDGYIYTMTPDPGWLAGAQYPVVIDPSFYSGYINTAGAASAVHDSPNSASIASPTMYVGAPNANQAGAQRGFLRFNVNLPLDVEVDNARFVYWVTGQNVSYGYMTIEAREFPVYTPQLSDAKWGTAPNLFVGSDLTHYAVGAQKTSNYGGKAFDYYGLDMTHPVQAWADKRYVRDGSGVLRQMPLQIVIRDVTDQPNGTGSGNVLWINPYEDSMGGYSTPSRLEIYYSTNGWYTFQGNKRRTGLTQYPISADATVRWNRPLTELGAILSYGITPAPVAVPNSANPTSVYPVIYTAVTDGSRTLVYRFGDLGASFTETHTELLNFQVTGTPMVIPGSSSTEADKVIVVGNGKGADLNKAKVYRLDALTSGGTTTWTQPWGGPRVIEQAETQSSPAYYTRTATYTQHNANGTTVGGFNTGVIILNINNGGAGYMIALSLLSGKGSWGHVDPNGNFVTNNGTFGGLPPLQFPSTTSSPSLMGITAAYTNDLSCYNNARKMDDGSYLWKDFATGSPVYGTVSIYNGHLFHAEAGGDVVTMDSLGDNISSYSDIYGGFMTTGAFSPDHQVVVYGNVIGEVFGLNTDINPQFPNISERWQNRNVVESFYAIYGSALVAGQPGSDQANVFIAAEDGFVHVLDPATGLPAVGSDGFSVLVGNGSDGQGHPNPLSGAILASMAAYKGRLYVLSSGTTGMTSPTLYCFN